MVHREGGSGPLFVLLPHAGTRAGHSIQVRMRRAGGALELRYRLEGGLDRLELDPAPGGELWQHTCFEIFLRRAGMPAYYEFNFAPNGEWRAYGFSDYRAGGPLEDRALDPVLSVQRGDASLELVARVALARLGLGDDTVAALSAVLEARDGALSYWALRHPPGRPDFHHPDAFAARLDALRD